MAAFVPLPLDAEDWECVNTSLLRAIGQKWRRAMRTDGLSCWQVFVPKQLMMDGHAQQKREFEEGMWMYTQCMHHCM